MQQARISLRRFAMGQLASTYRKALLDSGVKE